MAIKITFVNDQPVANGKVSVPYTTELLIKGTGVSGFVKVVVPSASPPPSTRVVRVNGTSKNWGPAEFNVTVKPDVGGNFNSTATNQNDSNDFDTVTITVQKDDKKQIKGAATVEQVSRPNPRLALDPPPPGNPITNPLFIFASGTVLDPQNSVSCTLTPIDANGSSTGPPQNSPASMNGNSWTVTFLPEPAPIRSQSGRRIPTPVSPNPFKGLYLFEATAANEGTLSIGVDAGG